MSGPRIAVSHHNWFTAFSHGQTERSAEFDGDYQASFLVMEANRGINRTQEQLETGMAFADKTLPRANSFDSLV